MDNKKEQQQQQNTQTQTHIVTTLQTDNELKDTEQFPKALRDLLIRAKLHIRDCDLSLSLGYGAYGTVYEAEYNGIPCAAKQVHPSEKSLRRHCLYTLPSELENDPLNRVKLKEYFIQECLLHSQLKHRNIVKMLGVTYRHDNSDKTAPEPWPVLVMELMEHPLGKLTQDENLFIPMYVKLSILQDISAGLSYLHTLNPPIVHCDLTPYNILLTRDLVAKLSDFGEAKVEKRKPKPRDWMAVRHFNYMYENEDDTGWQLYQYEIRSSYYTASTEVFSFGCIACHVITQKWPPSRYHVDLLEGHHSSLYMCQEHIYHINEGPVKELIRSCLENDQTKRPPITLVHEGISNIMKSKQLLTFNFSNNVVISLVLYALSYVASYIFILKMYIKIKI